MLPAAITDHTASALLEITWPDGSVGRLPHGALRAACRCAGCEQQRRRGTLTAHGAARLAAIRPFGDGLNLVFDDGHDRGIYPWPYLQELSDRFRG